jgi:branched-chain amino acid transport system permease protein
LRNLFNIVATHRVLAVVALLLLFPLVIPYEALAINILIFGLYAVGFNLLFGYTGMLSFGHAAFLGVGSYLCGIAIVYGGWPWWAAIIAGALAQIVYYVFYKAESWTGGENGLRGITVEKINLLGFSLDFVNPTTKYYVILVFVVAALWLVSRVLNSPFGAVMEAIRENEPRAAACGYDVARAKLLVFVLSAALCGLAGALRALHLSIVPIDSLHYMLSGQAVMMCLLGGMGTFFGPFVGAAAFLYLEDVTTTYTTHWMAVVGGVFMIFVLFFPRGIWGSAVHWLGRRAAVAESAK